MRTPLCHDIIRVDLIDPRTKTSLVYIHFRLLCGLPPSQVPLALSRVLFPDFCLSGSHPELPEESSTGDRTLQLAFDALDAADYPHAASLVNEAIEQGISWDAGKAEAFNLRGTFKYVFPLPISRVLISGTLGSS